jgi:class 3 adenylate cyclase
VSTPPQEADTQVNGQPDAKARLAADETHLRQVRMGRRTLRFKDPELERAYLDYYFRDNLANIRFTLLSAIALWIVWGLIARSYLPPVERPFDVTWRLGIFIPMLLVGFVLSFTPIWRRVWEGTMLTIICLSILGWVFYVSEVRTMPVDYGYVGLILITAFAFALARLRFLLVMVTIAVALATYIPYAVVAIHIFGIRTVLATAFLLSFALLWGVAAYRMERSSRLLFLRERQLEWEHLRSDSLLLNILPQAIVDRLKAHPNGERVADAFDEVSVIFADAVDSTEHAAQTSPEEFAETLDRLFRRFDEIADRYGLEKIKTIGDAYMAVAGAPVKVEDHAERAANAALDILEEAPEIRWPTGDPVVVRVGMATGPAVAGVIGQRKFAYDLWGDTVNLASRLSETSGEAGRIQVTQSVADRLQARYQFSEPRLLDLKGKGPTPVRFLLARRP